MSYPLHSVNWDNIKILSRAHYSAETAYLEGALRWSLLHAGTTGLLALGPRDLTVTVNNASSAQITLYRCRAIAPDGSLVDYASGAGEEPLTCHVTAGGQPEEVRTVYLAVEQTKTPVPSHLHDAQTMPLRESGVLRFAARLTLDRDLVGHAMLPIARLRHLSHWSDDEGYLPPCARLGGHYRLLRRCRAIAEAARECTRRLVGWQQNAAASGRALVALIAPLGTLLDPGQTPRAHLERLIGALAGIEAILAADGLPAEHPLARALADAIEYADQGAGIAEEDERSSLVRSPDWGTALRYVQDALDALLSWLDASAGAPQPGRRPTIPVFASRNNQRP